MTNAVLECIKSRRSVRKFKPEQIRDEELAAVLEAASWAPSGSNGQTWRFTAIQNPDVLNELAETVRRAFREWTPDDDYPAKHRAVVNSQNDGYVFFYNAPTLVILSNIPGYQNAMADCSTAIQNLFLAAASLGLGSCWVNQLRWLQGEPRVRSFLEHAAGLPREHVICNAAAIGYPAQNPPAPARKDGVIHVIR